MASRLGRVIRRERLLRQRRRHASRPSGAYYTGDPERAAAEATLQAEITHAHTVGIAGAVAVAASLAAADTPDTLIEAALDHTPGTYVRRGLQRARSLKKATPQQAAQFLGNGSRITAQDTVPFALWAATRHLEDYPAGIRACVTAGGDMDTTAAIVGAKTGTDGIPPGWLDSREPLPGWLENHPAARVTYDQQANAAYIYFSSPQATAKAARMYACGPIEVDGMINLDFDENGLLVGLRTPRGRGSNGTCPHQRTRSRSHRETPTRDRHPAGTAR